MQTKTLDENSSDTLDLNNALACSTNQGTTPLNTEANNYFRVFDPAAFGITTTFHITQVSFQVNAADTAAGGVQSPNQDAEIPRFHGSYGFVPVQQQGAATATTSTDSTDADDRR